MAYRVAVAFSGIELNRGPDPKGIFNDKDHEGHDLDDVENFSYVLWNVKGLGYQYRDIKEYRDHNDEIADTACNIVFIIDINEIKDPFSNPLH